MTSELNPKHVPDFPFNQLPISTTRKRCDPGLIFRDANFHLQRRLECNRVELIYRSRSAVLDRAESVAREIREQIERELGMICKVAKIARHRLDLRTMTS